MAWIVPTLGFSRGPEMSVLVATSSRGRFLRILLTPPTTRSYIFLGEGLVLVLARIIDDHVLEEGLDVTLDGSVVDAQLRVEEKAALGDVEFTVGAEEVVHARHLHVVDPDREIEGGPRRLRPERGIGDGGARPHELAFEVCLARAVRL